MYKICVVEDEVKIQKELKLLLENANYEVKIIETFENIASQIVQCKPDLILLDIVLPNEDGISVCKQVRENSKVPIIFVTSKNSSMDELECMTLGGDDFIAKPYEPLVLLAHIAAVLKRSSSKEEKVLHYKNVELDILAAVISYKNKKVELSKNELHILMYLFYHSEQIITRDELMDSLWGDGNFIDDNTLSINISRIRQKLKGIDLENFIITKRGLGYQLLLREGKDDEI
ncbi:response regulator transcription factor [Eubacterium sp. MSJ-13]|uniref:response regulator transcription factor n=1 Tax=Eubacterium sp. MSJ-13 TaxID=2841513 RepID=UPI001C113D26|nr:response regulator transcription factor [Eubacterium sp. MSJ-13]MBU5477654.1 response regulator transcription factor [Eubacterium sp. MSJ-13]